MYLYPLTRTDSKKRFLVYIHAYTYQLVRIYYQKDINIKKRCKSEREARRTHALIMQLFFNCCNSTYKAA